MADAGLTLLIHKGSHARGRVLFDEQAASEKTICELDFASTALVKRQRTLPHQVDLRTTHVVHVPRVLCAQLLGPVAQTVGVNQTLFGVVVEEVALPVNADLAF